MPFYGPLQLSESTTGGDPRLTAFVNALQARGATGITSYPGAGGAGVGAIGYEASGGPLVGGMGPLNLGQVSFIEPSGGTVSGAGPGTPESLTGQLAPFQQAMCFPASMQIVLADGTMRSIAEVRPGDELTSWDEGRERVVVARIVKVIASAPVEDLRRVDGLVVSDWHRVAGETRWVRAIYLAPGDKVWTLAGLHAIERVTAPLPPEPVWNLSVEPTATFYVYDGERAWLVHNDGGGGGGDGGGGGVGGDPGDPGGLGEGGGLSGDPGSGGVSAGEAAAIGGEPGSPAGAAPGIGGGGGGSSASTGGTGGDVGMGEGDPGLAGPTGESAPPGEGIGAGSPRPGLASLAAMSAARASQGGLIGGIAGTAAGSVIGMPGLGLVGAGLGGLIGGGQFGGIGIGMGFGLGNAPGQPGSLGPAPAGGPSK